MELLCFLLLGEYEFLHETMASIVACAIRLPLQMGCLLICVNYFGSKSNHKTYSYLLFIHVLTKSTSTLCVLLQHM
jgi:hypothetical protein